MYKTALILYKLASVPRWLTINSKKFPEETLNSHLLGFNFIEYYFRILNASSRSVI